MRVVGLRDATVLIDVTCVHAHTHVR